MQLPHQAVVVGGTNFHQLPVKMQHMAASCNFMQVVDVLGDYIHVVILFKLDQAEMACIRSCFQEVFAPGIIELMDEPRVASVSVG